MMSEKSKSSFAGISQGFHESPAQSLSLNADAYTRPEWFDLDRKAILQSSWQWVCHVEKPPLPPFPPAPRAERSAGISFVSQALIADAISLVAQENRNGAGPFRRISLSSGIAAART